MSNGCFKNVTSYLTKSEVCADFFLLEDYAANKCPFANISTRRVKTACVRNDVFQTFSSSSIQEKKIGPTMTRICIPRVDFESDIKTWSKDSHLAFRFYF